MSQPLLLLYNSTRSRYLKFKSRYEKAVDQGRFETFNRKRKGHIIRQLRKLYNRLVELRSRLKLGIGAAAIGLMLAAVEPANAQVSYGPWQIQPRSKNPFRYFLQKTADDVPVAVDLDNDGDLDFAIGTDAGPLRYIQNNGTPERPALDELSLLIHPLKDLDISNQQSAPTFADLDEDNDLDVIVGNYDGIIEYFRNDGGSYTKQVGPWVHTSGVPGATGNPFDGLLFSTGTVPYAVDFDDDGDLDILIGHNIEYDNTTASEGSLDILLNNDYASFALVDRATSPVWPEVNSDRTIPRMVDYDNDGDKDLFIAHLTNEPSVMYFRNDGTTFEYEDINPFGLTDLQTSIEIADFDADGDPDFLIGGTNEFDLSDQRFHYFINDGSFSLTPYRYLENPFEGAPATLPPASPRNVNAVFIDVDDDSDLDTFIGRSDVIGKYGPGAIEFYRNDFAFDGLHEFIKEAESPNFNFPAPGFAVAPTAVDWDSDGDLDIVTGSSNGRIAVYFNQDASENWSEPVTETFLDLAVPGFARAVPAFLDIDLDGDMDAFVAYSDLTIHFFRHEGGDPLDPNYIEVTGPENPFDGVTGGISGIPQQASNISVADFNGDGYPDISIPDTGVQPVIYIYSPPAVPGNDGTFNAIPNADNQFRVLGLLNPSFNLIDYDGDGDKDMFVGNALGFIFNGYGPLNYFVNTNPAPVYTPTATEITVAAGVDVEIDPNSSLTDPDNDLIIAASVSLNNYEVGLEALFIQNPPAGITTTFGDGVLHILGPASASTFQAALRDVVYRYDKDGVGQRTSGRTFSRTITISVVDADGTIGATSSGQIFLSHNNDAPVLNPGVSTVAFSNSAVVLHGTVTTADADDLNLQSAEVRFINGYVNTEDVLSFTNAFGITGNFDPSTGTLTLTGDRPVADYEAALRTIQYNNSLGAGATLGPRELAMTVNDGENASNQAQLNLLLSGNAPTLTSAISSTPFIAPTVVVNSNITVTDADNVNLQSATIAINAGFQASQDRLDFVNTANISGSYSAATGVLTLTGNASLAEYEAALESITYTNSTPSPAKQTRVISFIVNDGNSTGNTLSVGVVYPNTAPVVGPLTGSVNFTGANVVINSAFTISDDDASLTAAVVAFNSGYVTGEDELVFANQNGITGTFNPSSGTLTLLGSSSVANYATALRSVQYRNTAANRTIGSRVLRFSVNDGAIDGNLSVITVNVANNPPVLVSSTTPKNYTTGDLVVDPAIVVSDTDNSTLASAVAVISSGLQQGQDELLFTNQNGISGSYDATTGTLTLTGVASVANYQDALRSVQFRNGNAVNRIGGPRVVSFTVNDGGGNSNTTSATLNVVSIAPVIASASNIFYISGETVINGGITVTDADNTTLQSATVVITTGLQSGEDVLLFNNQNGIIGSYTAATGTLTLTGVSGVASYQTALRSVRYNNISSTPNTADRIVAFSVNDGTGNVTLPGNIVRLNKPPEIDIESQQTYVGGNVAFPTQTIFSDPDDNLDLSTLVVQSAHGARILIEGGVLTIDYSNVPDYEGFDELTITVCDVGGRCNTTTITVEVGADPVIYNGMSPNGDGVNDFFFVQFAPPDTEVAILNRWGDVIFETKTYDNTDSKNRFEGKNKNGTDVVDGAYYYKVRYIDGKDIIEKKGSLLIKR